MVIYFTGTGNSKYLANMLASHLGDEVIDGARLIKEGRTPSFSSDKPYVFVSPVYAWRLPRVFEKWIKKCSFEGGKKAYFVLDCGGEIGAAGNYTAKLSENIGLIYMGTAEVVMPENYLVMFEPTKEEDDSKIISSATENCAALAERISSESPLGPVKVTLVGRLESGIVNSLFYTFTVSARGFYTKDTCISCGKCVKGCMLNNITLKDGKPVWGKDCTHCMACICGCPTEAIEYGRATKGRRRYFFDKNEL